MIDNLAHVIENFEGLPFLAQLNRLAPLAAPLQGDGPAIGVEHCVSAGFFRVLVMKAAAWLLLKACSGFLAGFRCHIAAAARQRSVAVCKNRWDITESYV